MRPDSKGRYTPPSVGDGGYTEREREAMRTHIERNLDTIAEEPSEDEIKRLAARLEEMSEEERAAWFRRQVLQVTVMDEMMEEALDLIVRHGVAKSPRSLEGATAKAVSSARRAKPQKHARRSGTPDAIPSFREGEDLEQQDQGRLRRVGGVIWRSFLLFLMALWCGLGAFVAIIAQACYGD